MASPLPPDPYVALGVPKDADVSAIRTAHRKLALKFHPDRIKDESQREKGKDEFQKIQQAYELLSDPVRRSRYDDRVRLAELRKEAVMRDPPPRTTTTTATAFPMRPAPQPAPSTAQYREDGNFYEEVRQPRNAPAYDYRDPYDEPSPRTTSRKYPEYEKRAPPQPKPTEKAKKASSTLFGAAMATSAGMKWKTQTEKSRSSKAEEKRSDREKKRERSEKVQGRRTAYVEDTDTDSDYTEVRPSLKPSSRSKTTSEYPRRTTSRTEKTRDADLESIVDDGKWERHHEESKAYQSKAANRPHLARSGSSDIYQYWGGNARAGGRRSGSDNEKQRPTSSKGRRAQTDDFFSPPFSKSSSSPSHMRAHVEERAPPRSTVGTTTTRDRERDRERDRNRDRERDHRKMMPPGLHRSQTDPVPKSSSKKDTAPSKGSNLKHGDTHMHDSGYGSSSSPHTPEMREESPPRTSKPRHAATTSTRYQVMDPASDEEDQTRAPRITKLYDEDDRYRRFHSPEPISKEPISREPQDRRRPEWPKVETTSRPQSSRAAAMMEAMAQAPQPVRRSNSGRYEERVSPRSPHETPPISRNNSGREKLFGEMSPDEREPSRYTRPYPAEKTHMAPRRDPAAAKYATYSRDPPEYRDNEHSSRFRDTRQMRRPSVSIYG